MIKRGAHTNVKDLEKSIQEYRKRYNADPKPFVAKERGPDH